MDTDSNVGLLAAIVGKEITVTAEIEVESLTAGEYFYFAVCVGTSTDFAKSVTTYTPTSHITQSFEYEIDGAAAALSFVMGIRGAAENTGSIAHVHKLTIDTKPSQYPALGVAQSSGDRGDVIEVCTSGITTSWVYTAGATVPLVGIKGLSGRPREAMTIANGAGALDITGESRAPFAGQCYNDHTAITAGASRVDVILGLFIPRTSCNIPPP